MALLGAVADGFDLFSSCAQLKLKNNIAGSIRPKNLTEYLELLFRIASIKSPSGI
jgi:hypothetical protein